LSELRKQLTARAKLKLNARKKAIQQAQKRKQPASREISSSNKRQKCAGAAHAGVQAQDELSAAPPKVTS
jgi:hypothetical protein